jgi:hypothetical protein
VRDIDLNCRRNSKRYFAARCVRAAGLICLVIAAGACNLASVKPQATTASVSAVPPSMIVVYDFATTSAAVTLNQGILQRAYRSATMSDQEEQASESKTAVETAEDLSDDLVQRLGTLGFTARKIARGTPPPDGALAVDGEFVTIDEGNRARRLIIGFGAGASKLDTQVSIYEVAGGRPNQLMIFTTHAESNKMPGAAVTMGAGAAAQGGATVAMGAASAGMAGVKTYRSAMGNLADQTAKQITAYFSQYAANQRWIPEDKVQKAEVDQAPQQ